ncbi:MAG: methionyl-tRNA formyltransferase [Oceanospirillaceae bacterium]
MQKNLRIIFAGTPEFAAQTLQALLSSHHEVVAVYTQPDRPSGRGKKLSPSAVKKTAQEHDIPVYQPLNFKAEVDLHTLQNIEADIMVVVAYGIILPLMVLATPPLGCINVHASLLPRWRGAAPIERALLAGDTETGVTIMQMDQGLDTGDMLNKCNVDITPTTTSGQLYQQLVHIGASSLISTLDQLANHTAVAVKQDDSLSCYAEKLYKAEGAINWHRTADEVSRQIRGLSPRPVAFSSLDNQVIRIWNAVAISSPTQPQTDQKIESQQCGVITKADKNGIEVTCLSGSKLLITELQLPSGKHLTVQQVINSKKELFFPGNKFIQQVN